MKLIVTLTVSLTAFSLLWLLHSPASNDASPPPASASNPATSATQQPLPSSSPLADSIRDIGKKTGPRSVKVSEWAIHKAADDESARLKEPLKSLFQRWGLGENALSDALGLIHDRRVQTGLADNQRADEMMAFTAHEADKRYQQRHSAIATHYEAEMLIVLGSLQRLFEMTTLVTQINIADNKASAPARKAQSDQIKQGTVDLVDRYKAAHGSNYQQAMRERFGDTATASMLQLAEGTYD